MFKPSRTAITVSALLLAVEPMITGARADNVAVATTAGQLDAGPFVLASAMPLLGDFGCHLETKGDGPYQSAKVVITPSPTKGTEFPYVLLLHKTPPGSPLMPDTEQVRTENLEQNKVPANGVTLLGFTIAGAAFKLCKVIVKDLYKPRDRTVNSIGSGDGPAQVSHMPNVEGRVVHFGMGD